MWHKIGFRNLILNGLLNDKNGAAEINPLIGNTVDRCIANNAPILMPQTKTLSHLADKSANRCSVNSIQSEYFIKLQSSMVVPWPGKLSALTKNPLDDRKEINFLYSYVVLVKPWISKIPIFESVLYS